MPEARLHLGDCLSILKTLETGSVDAVVTDPPAGIAFMGKDWDRDKGGRREWIAWLSSVLAECLRVAKPGSVLLCWALPRTSHWTGTAIENAGWIIEDRIAHHFGSGFPKHKSKLKPATEDWWLARKLGPKWLGVESTRVSTAEKLGRLNRTTSRYIDSANGSRAPHPRTILVDNSKDKGRWPANLVLSHSSLCGDAGCDESCPVRLLGEQSGERRPGERPARCHGKNGSGGTMNSGWSGWDGRKRTVLDSGTAARYFANFDADPFLYCPKASRKDRGAGNTHPTVKPTALMRWLCRLATPPDGTVLDPFAGSGSTGVAAALEGFGFIGIEQSAEYHKIASDRLIRAKCDALATA